jgi:hypothetical protein
MVDGGWWMVDVEWSQAAAYFAERGLGNAVVVSPDAGGVPRAKEFRKAMERRSGVAAGKRLAALADLRVEPPHPCISFFGGWLSFVFYGLVLFCLAWFCFVWLILFCLAWFCLVSPNFSFHFPLFVLVRLIWFRAFDFGF